LPVFPNLLLQELDLMPPTNFLKIWKIFTISLCAFALTGCGSLPTLNGATSSSNTEQSQVTEQIGTNGQLISIQSDNVRAAGYDEASLVMTVQFDNGALYEYYDVPSDLWIAFVSAQPDPWSQVGYPRLVQGGIPYKRIG
jgi:hypothetical protein